MNQSSNVLGTFSDPNANGNQSWHWIPLLGTNGQPAVVSLGGVDTLKVTAAPAAGNITGVMNANFYMFVPYTAVSPVLHQCLGQCGHGFDQVPDAERAQLHGAIQHQLEPNQLADVVRRQQHCRNRRDGNGYRQHDRWSCAVLSGRGSVKIVHPKEWC